MSANCGKTTEEAGCRPTVVRPEVIESLELFVVVVIAAIFQAFLATDSWLDTRQM